MEIEFTDQEQLLSSAALAKAESRSTVAFAKFGDNVQSVSISVTDVNGPRGGADKQCRVFVKLKRLNNVVVTAKDESLSRAISSALNRAARSVSRQLNRRAADTNRGRSALPGFQG